MRRKENEHREKERNEQRARRWSELAQQTQRALNEDDWQGASQAYFGQAVLLFAEGKEHCHAASEAHKFALMSMREAGIKKVKISTAQDSSVMTEAVSTRTGGDVGVSTWRYCRGCGAVEIFISGPALKNQTA